MKFKSTFQACSADYSGYVNPTVMMRTINEGVAKRNYLDGVGFEHLYPTIGVTWMLGQCVMEFKKAIPTATEVEMETGGHEQFGVSVVRRSVMYYNGEEAMTFATKLLPVYFQERKVVPPEVLEPFWKTSAEPCGEPISFIHLPENMTSVEQYRVHYRDCDSNKHMTAFRYLDLILEAVDYWSGELHLAERIQIDYKKECLPGDVLDIRLGKENGIQYCSGVKEDGTVSFNAAVKLSAKVTMPADIFQI